MQLEKTDIQFAVKGLIFFSLVFLGLFNPEELIANLKEYSVQQVSFAEYLKENLEFALTFKKIFLK